MTNEANDWSKHWPGASDLGIGHERIDVAGYTSPEVYREECDKIFRRAWIAVARESEIPEPGDFIKVEIWTLDTQAILVRGRDNEVRAFYNSCAHRGAALVRECEGRTNLFRCPYHGWSYGTDGKLKGLPGPEEFPHLDKANTGLTLCLAINYGARAEIVDAFRDLAEKVKRGELEPDAIDESAISNAMYTAGMEDPDLLIRTAGEMRISNYLLWQISYAELWVTSKFWPEFDAALLHEALRDFAKRERRFGGLVQKTED